MPIYKLICKKCHNPFEHITLHIKLSEERQKNTVCEECKYKDKKKVVYKYYKKHRKEYLKKFDDYRKKNRDKLAKTTSESRKFYKRKRYLKSINHD
jgi:hypothetical protein